MPPKPLSTTGYVVEGQPAWRRERELPAVALESIWNTAAPNSFVFGKGEFPNIRLRDFGPQNGRQPTLQSNLRRHQSLRMGLRLRAPVRQAESSVPIVKSIRVCLAVPFHAHLYIYALAPFI